MTERDMLTAKGDPAQPGLAGLIENLNPDDPDYGTKLKTVLDHIAAPSVDAVKLVDELLSGSFETMEQVDAARDALLDHIAAKGAEIERLKAERDAWAKSKRELQHQQYEHPWTVNEAARERSRAEKAEAELARLKAARVPEELREAAALAFPSDLRTGPFKTDLLADSPKGGDVKLFDVRGWGFYTGKGHGALGVSDDEARLRMSANADFAVLAWNFVRSLLAAHPVQSPARQDSDAVALLRECPSCQGNGGEIDTTYDRTGAWSSCHRCNGTGLIYVGSPSEKARAALNPTGDA